MSGKKCFRSKKPTKGEGLLVRVAFELDEWLSCLLHLSPGRWLAQSSQVWTPKQLEWLALLPQARIPCLLYHLVKVCSSWNLSLFLDQLHLLARTEGVRAPKSHGSCEERWWAHRLFHKTPPQYHCHCEHLYQELPLACIPGQTKGVHN